MIFVWGSKLYGKVDEIEGLGHVATEFGHLFWIPVIPKCSYFVTEEDKHTYQGMPIGLSAKSVLVAYARAASIIFFVAALGAINTMFNPTEVIDPERVRSVKTTIILGVLAIPTFFYVYSRPIRFADYETAIRLADRIGFDERWRTCIELLYDRIDNDEAERRLAAPEAEAEYVQPTFDENFDYETFKEQYA